LSTAAKSDVVKGETGADWRKALRPSWQRSLGYITAVDKRVEVNVDSVDTRPRVTLHEVNHRVGCSSGLPPGSREPTLLDGSGGSGSRERDNGEGNL